MFTGENAKLLRTIKGIPQKTVAKKLGISQAAISKIEHSKKLSDAGFERFLKAVNCTKEEFEKMKKILSQ